jgi:uncharacterized protein (DUF488 family)
MVERARVMGWGYQGQAPEDLRAGLDAWGVVALVDVRLNPVSRKPGFSRKALASLCEEAGVRYVHMRDLGNPRDNRDGFAAVGRDRESAHSRYRTEVLESDSGRAALTDLAGLTSEGLVLVVCFESAEACCHRSLVLAALRDELVPA